MDRKDQEDVGCAAMLTMFLVAICVAASAVSYFRGFDDGRSSGIEEERRHQKEISDAVLKAKENQ